MFPGNGGGRGGGGPPEKSWVAAAAAAAAAAADERGGRHVSVLGQKRRYGCKASGGRADILRWLSNA